MEMTQDGYSLVVGVDVSKAKLDIAWGSTGPLETIENTNEQIARLLIKKIKDHRASGTRRVKPRPDIKARGCRSDE